MVRNTISKTKVSVSDCGESISEIQAYSLCANAAGVNFGRGKVVGSSDGATFFSHTMKTKIPAEIYAKPRVIERTISAHCKTQRTRSAALYVFDGTSLLPEWKKDEIEAMFMQENLIINGFSVVQRGGSIITSLGEDCEGLFTLKATIEECAEEFIFGCTSAADCLRQGGVFVVPEGNDINTPVYSSNGLLVGNVGQLGAWLGNQQGVEDSEEITTLSGMPCAPYKVFKVAYNSEAADRVTSFYLGQPRPQNKVIMFQTDYDTPDLLAACNGVDYTGCTPLVLGTVSFTTEDCGVLTLGTVAFSDSLACAFVADANLFDIEGYGLLTTHSAGVKRLTIVGKSSKYILPPAYNQASTSHEIIGGEEAGFIAGLSSLVVNSVSLNGAWMDTDEFIYDDGTDTLSKTTGVWTIGDEVEYFYAAGVPSMPYVTRMHVGNIGGCVPPETVFVTIGTGVVEVNATGAVYYTGILYNIYQAGEKTASVWTNPDFFGFTIDFTYST